MGELDGGGTFFNLTEKDTKYIGSGIDRFRWGGFIINFQSQSPGEFPTTF
jgi:hypothetical protein